jgi:hypothetical protein
MTKATKAANAGKLFVCKMTSGYKSSKCRKMTPFVRKMTEATTKVTHASKKGRT